MYIPAMHALFATLVVLGAVDLSWVEVSSPPAIGPVLPYTRAPERFFEGAPPLAELAQAGPTPRARLWGAYDAQHVYLHVEVRDPAHVNSRAGAAIYDGDALQVSVDPHGAVAPNLSPRADFLAPGALYAAFALTP
jgi:hypothetical protein